MATVLLLSGISFLVYCGSEYKVAPEANLASGCLPAGLQCDRNYSLCCTNDPTAILVCKSSGKNKPDTCQKE
jgi:hypothetical protein